MMRLSLELTPIHIPDVRIAVTKHVARGITKAATIGKYNRAIAI